MINVSYAVDYYPELGMDPFYSSLNPAYVDEEDTDTSGDSIVEMLRNKQKQKNTEKVKKERKFFNFKKNVDKKNNKIDETLDDELESVDIDSEPSVLPDGDVPTKSTKETFVAPKKNRGANLLK